MFFKYFRQREYKKLALLDTSKKYPLLKNLLNLANKVSFNNADFVVKKRYFINSSTVSAEELLILIREARHIIKRGYKRDIVLFSEERSSKRLDLWLKTTDGYKMDYLSLVTELIDESNLFLNELNKLNSTDIFYFGSYFRSLTKEIIEALELIIALELGIPNNERHWRSA